MPKFQGTFNQEDLPSITITTSMLTSSRGRVMVSNLDRIFSVEEREGEKIFEAAEFCLLE